MHHPIEKLGHTVNEASHAIGVGRTKIYEEIKEKRLRVIKIGRRTIITNVKDYMAQLEKEAGHAEAS